MIPRRSLKTYLATLTIKNLVPFLPYVSGRLLYILTYLAERILSRPDPIVEKAIRAIRNYFINEHPSLKLAQRIFREVNFNCRKRLIECFFINAIFRGVSKSKDFAEREGFSPPWFLVLSPTMRCNLNCEGCSTRKYKKDDDLPISIIDRLLSEAKDMGIHFIVTQGGEMFVYEEMMQIYEKHRDIYFQVYTNGTLIDKEMAKRLSYLGNVAPMISLEGFEEETDRRRGRGIFKKVMQAMDNLKKEKVFFGASVTQTRANSKIILQDRFWHLLLEKGCFVVWFFQFLPIGKDPSLELMPTPEQRAALREKIQEIREKLPLFIGDFWNDGPFVGGCIAGGRRYVHINNKGDVEPCAFVHFAVDNIKEKSLKEALNSGFFRYIRQRQPFGENLLTPCMIIDQPEVLREAVRKFSAQATHEGADLIFNGNLKEGLDSYSRRIHEIYDPVWEMIKDKAVKWP